MNMIEPFSTHSRMGGVVLLPKSAFSLSATLSIASEIYSYGMSVLKVLSLIWILCILMP